MSELPPCCGGMNNKGAWSFGSRRGLLAYVYSGVSLTMNALVAGNGSYIVRLSVRDLHGPTSFTWKLLFIRDSTKNHIVGWILGFCTKHLDFDWIVNVTVVMCMSKLSFCFIMKHFLIFVDLMSTYKSKLLEYLTSDDQIRITFKPLRLCIHFRVELYWHERECESENSLWSLSLLIATQCKHTTEKSMYPFQAILLSLSRSLQYNSTLMIFLKGLKIELVLSDLLIIKYWSWLSWNPWIVNIQKIYPVKSQHT